MENSYLSSVISQLRYYKSLGEKTMAQLTDEQLQTRPSPESNSVATVVKHLHGNMMSRWTDFLNADGEKEWRNRDDEFEGDAISREKILELWEEGWKCLFEAITPLNEKDLERIVYIRNQGHTVVEAINRQLAHYPYHVGQIVFIGKMFTDANWKSLSIPRNKSAEFNAEKFSREKHREHYTEEFLKEKKK